MKRLNFGGISALRKRSGLDKMKIFLFPSILLLFLLSSCGTLKKPHNIIPVVSKEGSRKFIYLDENEELKKGETPTWVDLPSGRVHEFYLTKEDLKLKKGMKVRCDLRWSRSVIPALVFAPIFPVGTVVGGSMFSLDLMTGRSHECDDLVWLEGKGKKITFGKPKILALPVPLRDEILSKKVILTLEKFLKGKGELVSYESAEDAFSDYGLSSYRTFSDMESYKKNYRSKLRYRLAASLKATHLAFFKVLENEKGEISKVEVHFENAFEGGNYQKLKKLSLSLKNLNREESFSRTFFSAFRFLPNSISAGYKQRTNNNGIGPVNANYTTFSLNDHPDAFPKAVTFLGLESVEHPQFYSPWDFGAFFGPGLGTASFQGQYRLFDGTQKILNTSGYFFDFSLTVVGFSPFGQLSVSLGPSMNLLFQDDEITGQSYTSSRLGIRIGVAHKFFLTDRLYTILSYTSYGVDPKADLDPTLQIAQIQSTFIGLGYYFPQLTNLMRSWTSHWF